MKGRFVVFEGIDRSGKSTQIELLKEKYKNDDQHAFFFDPGSTKLGMQLRQIVKNGIEGEELDEGSELLLFTAARAQMCNSLIIPALVEGKTVICDRFLASTMVYQGFTKSMHKSSIILELHEQFCSGLTPDLTFLFKIPMEIYKKRGETTDRPDGVKDRFENEQKTEYASKIMQHYNRISHMNLTPGIGKKIVEIDGSKDKEEIFTIIETEISKI